MRLDGVSKISKKITGTSLYPILESDDAQAVHLKHLKMPKSTGMRVNTSRRTQMTELSDPDNGIMFLDNFDRVYNPTN